MATSVTPVLPVTAAKQAAAVGPELVLRPGTTIDATVLKVLSADLVRIAIASLSIDVKTEIPLQQGQALKLAVSQTENGIRLTNVGGGAIAADVGPDAVTLSPDALLEAPTAPASGAPPKAVLTPLEKATVTIAAQTAATEQGGQGTLFANLASVAASPALPPRLLHAMQQVLAQQTGLAPGLDGADIKQAFEKSGLLLEASLAAGAVPQSGSAPDLKAALLVLRQTLQTVLGGQSAETPALPKAGNAPALAPTAAQELEPQEILLPQARVAVAKDVGEAIVVPARAGLLAVLKDAPAAATPGALRQTLPEPGQAAKAAAFSPAPGDEVHTNTPPPPFRGALPSPQPVLPAAISPQTPLAPAAHHLLADTEAAIARHTLLQVASLPDRIDALPQPALNNDTAGPRWSFEVPFATQQGTAMVQFEISRDGDGTEVEAARKVWRARFTLDVEPSGPVHALIALVGDKTSVRMWAERPATAERLRDGSAELSSALARAELKPGDIVVRDGTPPQPQGSTAGHFLDRAL
ncbi:flagellar hook-length control protein FliK [Bradyrhizobium sp.]|uniref:flagellar hook-length control protein FliK n=1 Tax=Bradyrhizobium sp. TaxID=376 RepID=UPI004037A7BB